ncbi:MAG: CdaR family protein [Anaerolineales bacterium]
MGNITYVNPFKALWRNRETLLLALLLAMAVWVSAVFANDPNVDDVVSGDVPLELIGLADNLVFLDSPPDNVSVRLRAPQSVWQKINDNPELVKATVNFTGVEAGSPTLPVNVTVQISPAQVLEVLPETVTVSLENEIVEDMRVDLVRVGDPAPGFQVDAFSLSPDTVSISGPESRVGLVTQVVGTLSISGVREDFTDQVTLVPMDQNNRQISGVTVTPNESEVRMQISQIGGYRDVAVKVETTGQPLSGYRVTSVAVEPPTITLYSENEELIAGIQGFVSTLPVDLTGNTGDIEVSLGLDLPNEVLRVGDEQTVLVKIGIAPIVTSLTMTVPISVSDLAPGLRADLSPDTVDLIITGPEPVIQNLTIDDVIVFVSLDGYREGSYLVEPEFEVLLEQLNIDSINPDTIEVTISVDDGTISPTATPTNTPTP